MSDLPGEITKQTFRAPPRTILSIRYSLTARGRSAAPSRRLPTGSSSFENASGWMRLPIPAAGIIPHISEFRPSGGFHRQAHGRLQDVFQLERSPRGGVSRENAFSSGPGDQG